MVENEKSEAEGKMLQLIEDNEKLNSVLIDKFREIDVMNRQLQNLSVVGEEKNLLERDHTNLKERIMELERNINALLNENDKLNGGMHERLTELELWMSKYRALEQESKDRLSESENRHQYEMERYQLGCQQELAKYEQEIERLSKKVGEFEGLVDSQARALQHKDGVIEERYLEIENLRVENRDISVIFFK